MTELNKLDQFDDGGTITREEYRRAANGNEPQPKPMKLCACGCGKPFEAVGARKYYPGHAPGPSTAPRKRTAKEPALVRAGLGGNEKTPPPAAGLSGGGQRGD